MDLPAGYGYRAPNEDDADAVGDGAPRRPASGRRGADARCAISCGRCGAGRTSISALTPGSWLTTPGRSSRMGRRAWRSRRGGRLSGALSIPSIAAVASARRCSTGSKSGPPSSSPAPRHRASATRSAVPSGSRGNHGHRPRPPADPPFLAHADRPRWTGRAGTVTRRDRDRRGSSRRTIFAPSTPSSRRRSWTTRAIIPSRSNGGWTSTRAARATTRRSG